MSLAAVAGQAGLVGLGDGVLMAVLAGLAVSTRLAVSTWLAVSALTGSAASKGLRLSRNGNIVLVKLLELVAVLGANGLLSLCKLGPRHARQLQKFSPGPSMVSAGEGAGGIRPGCEKCACCSACWVLV